MINEKTEKWEALLIDRRRRWIRPPCGGSLTGDAKERQLKVKIDKSLFNILFVSIFILAVTVFFGSSTKGRIFFRSEGYVIESGRIFGFMKNVVAEAKTMGEQHEEVMGEAEMEELIEEIYGEGGSSRMSAEYEAFLEFVGLTLLGGVMVLVVLTIIVNRYRRKAKQGKFNIYEEIEERELKFMEILYGGGRFFRQNFRSIVIIICFLYIPLLTMVYFLEKASFSPNHAGMRIYQSFFKFFYTQIGFVMTMAVALLVEGSLEERKLHWKTALTKALRKWPRLFVTKLVTGIVLLVYFIVIIPGIIYYIYFIFIIFAVALRDKKVEGAMSYSKEVVEKRWWRVFFFMLFLITAKLLLMFSCMICFTYEGYGFASVLILIISFQAAAALVTSSTAVFFLNLDKTRTFSQVCEDGELGALENLTTGTEKL